MAKIMQNPIKLIDLNFPVVCMDTGSWCCGKGCTVLSKGHVFANTCTNNDQRALYLCIT